MGTYSIYGFFPVVHDLVYQADRPPEIAFSGRTRGRIAMLRFEDGGLVVKPTQSSREGEIARIAAEMGGGTLTMFWVFAGMGGW